MHAYIFYITMITNEPTIELNDLYSDFSFIRGFRIHLYLKDYPSHEAIIPHMISVLIYLTS